MGDIVDYAKVQAIQEDFDETFRLVVANLAATGVQYSNAITAPSGGSASSFTVLYQATLTPKVVGNLLWVYFLIVVRLQQSGALGSIRWKAQVKNNGGTTWADLMAWSTVAADASVATDYRMEGDINWSADSGYRNITDANLLTLLNSVPIDFRVIFYTGHATETTVGRLVSSSQVRLVGKTV